jgi:hypothetical protein
MKRQNVESLHEPRQLVTKRTRLFCHPGRTVWRGPFALADLHRGYAARLQ